jgi:hypothetical protein
MEKSRINTSYLLSGIQVMIPATNNPPRSAGGGAPKPTTGPVPKGYIKTFQGFNFTMDAWSEYSRAMPTQIFLHHTAGSQRADKGEGTIRGWNTRNSPGAGTITKKNTTGRSFGSTHCVIDKNGVLERCVPENRKAHSEGVSNSEWGVSVELLGMGWFNKQFKKDGTYGKRKKPVKKGQWYRQSEYGKTLCPFGEEAKPVGYDRKELKNGYRGFPVYQEYTPAMIKTCMDLIKEWCFRYNIKFIFDQKAYDNMFPGKNSTPMLGKKTKGVFTHNSVKKSTEKTDVFPSPLLVQALYDNFSNSNNVTVTSYNESQPLPRTVPVWNPTEIQVGVFMPWDNGGFADKDKVKPPYANTP